MPRLLDSPTNANLPLMPLDAITPAMQIDPIVAAKLGRTVFHASAELKIQTDTTNPKSPT